MGVLAWVGLLTTAVGFVIAFLQLRKVQSSAAAARSAVAEMTVAVRSHEQSAKINLALDTLKSADEHLRKANGDAAAAYLNAGWLALLDARELTNGSDDQASLDRHIFIVRQMYEDIRSPLLLHRIGSRGLSEQVTILNRTVDGLGTMAAKMRARLSGIGVVQDE